MERTEWLEHRRKGIGGTDAAAILGLSKYRSPLEVWADKTGRTPLDDARMTEPMRWGLILETAIAGAYQETTSFRVTRTKSRTHPAMPFIIGSLDRVAIDQDGKRRVLELKTARSDHDYAPRGRELEVEPAQRIPARHYVQVQHYLGITGWELADVAVLFGGSDFRIYPVPRDEAFIVDLFSEEQRWWNTYVVPDVEPPASAGDDAYLRRRYPTSTTDELVGTADVAMTVEKLLDLKDQLAPLEELVEELEATVKSYMGEAGRLLVSGAEVSWKSYSKTTVDWKLVAASYRATLERLVAFARPGYMVDDAVQAVLSEGFGTTSLDVIESVYSRTSDVRPFRATRKEGKA